MTNFFQTPNTGFEAGGRFRILIAFTDHNPPTPLLLQAPSEVWECIDEANCAFNDYIDISSIPQPQRGPALYECEIEYWLQRDHCDEYNDGFKVVSCIKRLCPLI